MKTKIFNALSLAVITAMLVTSLALADNVQNDITAGGNDTFTVGGSTIVNYRITANNGDGQNGCNAADGTAAVVTIVTPLGVTASPNPLSFSACGTSLSTTFTASATGDYNITVSVADACTTNCGTYNTNPAKFTLHVLAAADTTAPVITPKVSGTLGSNDWYVSDVTVSWSVSDPESTVTSTTGCGSSTVNIDTAGQTFTCSATSAGGTSSQSVTIKRDATAPTISGSASPGPNANGWNNSDVTVSFICSDNLSGVASCGPNQTLSSNGANQSATGSAVDNAGNSASATVSSINIDKTAPTVSASPSPAANTNGWNNTNVTISFSGSDALSGLASCDAPVVLSSEGASQSATGSCTDMAGNSASATASGINIDKTAPTANASAAPAPNVNGWNNTNVTVSFSGSDGTGSGIDFCDAAVVLSSEGVDQSASGTCTDKAGNVSAPVVATANIDKTAPTVALVGGPADGSSYYFSFVPAVPTCSASDALSGLVGSCLFSGYGTGLGSHTVTASVSDKAGNSASASASYTVLAWTLYGFYKPVDMTLPGGEIVWNTVKGGSTVPLKFEVFAGLTELTDTSFIAATFTKQIACVGGTDDSVEVLATGSTSLRYDWTSGQFIYNWQTPKKPGQCYQVTMTTLDGSSLSAYFKLK